MASAGPGLWRALFAFLALPGVVAGAVPLGILRATPARERFVPGGLVPLGIGLFLLLWCVRDFYVAGRGTLAPWAPPQRLVVVGLYRFTRNPMYLAVLLVLCGWALTLPSRALWLYAFAVLVGFHLRVVLAEEPWLARTHGEAWREYRERVPRWLFF